MPQLCFTNTSRLHTRLTELLLTQFRALPCFLYCNVNSLMNVLEGECSWIRILERFINANNVVSLLLFVYFVYIYSCSVCCCIFVYLFIHFFMLEAPYYRCTEYHLCIYYFPDKAGTSGTNQETLHIEMR